MPSTCKRHANSLNARVIAEYTEPGKSGTNLSRPALKQLLTELKELCPDYVIDYDLSRVARDELDALELLRKIQAHGAQLESTLERVDDTPAGQLLFTIMAGVNAFRSRGDAVKIRSGLRQKAEAGGTPGRARLGYLNIPVIVDGREVRSIAVDPKRGPLITEAFQLYATGQYALSDLAAILEAHGLRSRPRHPEDKPRPLAVNQLAKLLRDRYYIGVVCHDGKSYEGRHDWLTDLVTFEEVQHQLTSRRQSGERSWRNHHYLRGSIFCAECGGRLFFTRVKGRSHYYDYFVCRGRQEHTGSQTNHRVEAVEAAIERYYGQAALPALDRERVRAQVLSHVEPIAAAAAEEREAAQATERRLDREERKLLDAHYADRISDHLFAAETERIGRERAAARKLAATLDVPYAQALSCLDLALDLTTDPQLAYAKANDSQRRWPDPLGSVRPL